MLAGISTQPRPPDLALAEILLQWSALVKNITSERLALSCMRAVPSDGIEAKFTQWHVRGINERPGLRLEVSSPLGLPRVSEETEMAISHLVQDSVASIVYQYGSDKAEVAIERNVEGIILTVRGASRGRASKISELFPRAISKDGVTSLGDRVKKLGGGVNIQIDERGMCVRAIIPDRSFARSYVPRPRTAQK
ncbi:MAG: hypothetical protein NVS9B13_26680 [Candidatus Acidiferrum sp.]